MRLATGEGEAVTSAVLFVAWYLADPPVGDAARLPPLPWIREAVAFNQRYQKHLDGELCWEPYNSRRYRALKAALDDAEWIRWNRLDAAWGSHPDYQCSDEAKQVYLRRLRLALGRDAYREMDLGPVVPLHHFAELR